MIDQKGKQFLIISCLCLMFFAIGMLAGGWIVWKQFRADQVAIKKSIVKIEKDERLAKSIIKFIEQLEEAGVTMEEAFMLWKDR